MSKKQTLTLSPSKRRKHNVMSCEAEAGKDAPCSCPRCDATRQCLERKQELSSLYGLPIYSLPPELILKIVDELDLIEFPAMIIAMFHLLRHHGIAPSMPTIDLKIFLKCSNPGGKPHLKDHDEDLDAKGFYRLPMEIRLEIYKHLCARDKINVVLATFEIPFDDIESLTHWRSPRIRKTSPRKKEESPG